MTTCKSGGSVIAFVISHQDLPDVNYALTASISVVLHDLHMDFTFCKLLFCVRNIRAYEIKQRANKHGPDCVNMCTC